MAILHHAYGFAPEAYLSALHSACVAGGVARPDALRSHASSIVKNADAKARKILEYLRYDDDWWSTEPPGSSVPEWLELSLVPHLREFPSLSHHGPHSYFVLDRVLPTVGWPGRDVDLLIRGESLESLPRVFPDPLLAPWFLNFRQHTGWMNRPSITRLAAALNGIEKYFRDPGLLQTAALADWQTKPPTDIKRAISLAFDDANEMLRRAQEENVAMVLLFE